MPRFRRNHSGKRVAYEIFEKFRGDWEVQPIENIIEVESILIDKLDK